MLPRCFLPPHQTNLSTYIGLIKWAENQVRSLGNARIGGHFGKQGRADTISNHLNDRRKAGRLVRYGDVFLSQLTGLKRMIAKTMAFLE